MNIPADERLREALKEVIEGRFVKRAKHDLSYEGVDLTPVFIDELARQGYRPSVVEAVKVEPGERVPAFLVESRVAYFGWVFWEQFTSWKMRKLWGSVIKNDRGDWNIQIPATRNSTIYSNESLKLEMDVDHPPEF